MRDNMELFEMPRKGVFTQLIGGRKGEGCKVLVAVNSVVF